MPLFEYKATDSEHNIVEGTTTANNQDDVAQILERKNLKLLSVRTVDNSIKRTGSLPTIERITFCRYAATMLNAGLPLSEGMSVLQQETKHPLMKQVLQDVLYHLEQGQNLSSVFAKYPQVFDAFFVTLIKAGEASGTLADSFKYLENQLRAEYALSQKIKSALMYPAIVFIAMVGIGFLMIFFIMPQIGNVFLTMTLPLPPVTEAIFRFAVSISAFRYPIMGGSVLLSIAVALFMRHPTGKRLIIKIISPTPVVKNLIKQMDIARFSRIFSTLIASAVPITQALKIAVDSLSYPSYRTKAAALPTDVEGGKSLAAAFHDNQVFPPLLTQMIAAGEKSGTLDKTLADLAEFYESEVEEAVKKATQLLEPLLMLLVGIGVGAMILSIIAPLYSVVGNLQLQN